MLTGARSAEVSKTVLMANNLRSIRNAKGLTQEQAAEALGTTRSHYVKLETGQRRLNDLWIERAATAFDLDAADIIRGRSVVTTVVGHANADGSVVIDLDQARGVKRAALHVRDALGPALAGWYAVLDQPVKPVPTTITGRLCVVGVSEDVIELRRIEAVSGRHGRWHLVGQFASPRFDVEIAWAIPIFRLSCYVD